MSGQPERVVTGQTVHTVVVFLAGDTEQRVTVDMLGGTPEAARKQAAELVHGLASRMAMGAVLTRVTNTRFIENATFLPSSPVADETEPETDE